MAALLEGIPFRILNLADFPGVDLPPEGESSYAENALAKARAVASATGETSLAYDLAALHSHALDQAFDWAADVHGLPCLDDAVELLGRNGNGRKSGNQGEDRGAAWHGDSDERDRAILRATPALVKEESPRFDRKVLG